MNPQEIIKKQKKIAIRKWSLSFKIMPLVIAVALGKFLAHYFGFEVMELNALFTTLVAGTIFLLGFLISGVLSDYKESEKIPSDLAASIKTLADDAYTIYKSKNSETAYQLIEYQKSIITTLMDWFYRRERTSTMLTKISMMNDYFAELDKEGIQANYIIKMKNEQNSLRKMVLRTHTIRDTEFVHSAYTIVEVMGLVIAIGMIIINIEPFYAALFFSLLVTFLISYMFFLIKDLDDPFDYSVKGEGGTEVPLRPVRDLDAELNDLTKVYPRKS